ncbi:MAG: DUF3556 domain-containing protein [Bacteroidota bacterium]
MKLLAPQTFPFDFEEWKKKPFPIRVKMLCQAWATQGYGAPVSVYVFYILKIVLYVWLWAIFCSFSTELGGLDTISSWWYHPEAFLKAILWSMVFEGIGLASGSGPLTARYFPPFGGILHLARPSTIKLPFLPDAPLIGGDKRNILDVGLYLLHLGLIIRCLIAPDLIGTPDLLIPTLILLPILGLLDRTIFLMARAEHYWIATFCFLFPMDALAGSKVVWWGVWFWAATSKLNRHFPGVIGVMLSNSAVMRINWVKKKLYKNYPEDLRASRFSSFLAHTGTALEYGFPLVLLFGGSPEVVQMGLIVMFLFHLFITANIPMGVPIEWNVMMVYGAYVLFGQHADVSIFSIGSPVLITALLICLLALQLLGNFYPRAVSFLISMRYYAGNWPYSVWLFKGNAEEKMDEHVVKASKTVGKQLDLFYDEPTKEMLLSRVISFRMMHLHARALHQLLPKAVDNIDDYTWRDGELVAGVALGWNFGDGHLHSEQMLKALQKRCNWESGELRCIFVESQPLGIPFMNWRIWDAKDGLIEEGQVGIDNIVDLQPWPEENQFEKQL